jgi:putative two-component system response regulator
MIPMRVLIVDDNATSLMLLKQVVGHVDGCRVVAFHDPLVALNEIRAGGVDIALVDYMMPQVDGIEFIRRVRALPRLHDLPIVFVTTQEEKGARAGALEAGATDFLSKPIDPSEVKTRIRTIARLREMEARLGDETAWLDGEVRKATAALSAREEETVFRLAQAAEFRDGMSGSHIRRMANYCLLIGEALGLDDGACRTLYLAAPMHDIGKIAVGDAILLKPGKLTPEERAVMEQHTACGYRLLAGSQSDLIRAAADIAWCHHERWDGSGYPRGLAGEQIPLLARIAAVADVFDALTSERPYKQAWSPKQAAEHIRQNSGKHFDPACVSAFFKRWEDVLGIHDSARTGAKAVA